MHRASSLSHQTSSGHSSVVASTSGRSALLPAPAAAAGRALPPRQLPASSSSSRSRSQVSCSCRSGGDSASQLPPLPLPSRAHGHHSQWRQQQSQPPQQQQQRRQRRRLPPQRAAAEPAAAAAAAAGAAASSEDDAPAAGTAAASNDDAAGLKRRLRAALAGADRGIFGLPSARRAEIAALVEALERLNPTPAPTADLAALAGAWRLLYTTVQITGAKKTKLGLREFVRLGDFEQHIDVDSKLARNVVQFSVAGLGRLSGDLTIAASFEVASDRRVAIRFAESSLRPPQLQALFEKNHDLLLSVFNPDGWLDVTYVDGELRVGRDDKGHVFVVEREARRQ